MSDHRRHYEVNVAALCRLLGLEGEPKLAWSDNNVLNIVMDDPTGPDHLTEPIRIGECESCHQQKPLFSLCPDCLAVTSAQPAF